MCLKVLLIYSTNPPANQDDNKVLSSRKYLLTLMLSVPKKFVIIAIN